MKTWKQHCNIKQHLTDDTSWEGITLATNNIAKELRLLPDTLFEGFGFENDVEFLEGVNVEDEEVYDNEQHLLNEVNFRLNRVYDFADCEKIWLG